MSASTKPEGHHLYKSVTGRWRCWKDFRTSFQYDHLNRTMFNCHSFEFFVPEITSKLNIYYWNLLSPFTFVNWWKLPLNPPFLKERWKVFAKRKGVEIKCCYTVILQRMTHLLMDLWYKVSTYLSQSIIRHLMIRTDFCSLLLSYYIFLHVDIIFQTNQPHKCIDHRNKYRVLKNIL